MNWSKVKKVRLNDGSKGRVIDYEEHKFGCDLRVISKDKTFWVDSNYVDIIDYQKGLL